jgi:hypothetical protein
VLDEMRRARMPKISANVYGKGNVVDRNRGRVALAKVQDLDGEDG